MKASIILLSIAAGFAVMACDVQSGISKKSVEEYTATPTPGPSRTPEPPIDPAEIATADTAESGPNITINSNETRKSFDCGKYNRVIINSDAKDIKIGGVCKQVMINGDRNKVAVYAAAGVVFNGSENSVEHAKFANGKRPIVTDNTRSNTFAKAGG